MDRDDYELPTRQRPRLLDLFCGAGGASTGYSRAGFEVVGVDIKQQNNYWFEFHRCDAFEFLLAHGKEFDVIHASPPCQAYSKISKINGGTYPDLVAGIRDALIATGKPYVIENVPGAPLGPSIVLCGTMFGLKTPCGTELRRHRYFECSHALMQLRCNHKTRPISITGNTPQTNVVRNKIRKTFTVDAARHAMGIGWMPMRELSQSIPPAYTEFIGRQLMGLFA